MNECCIECEIETYIKKSIVDIARKCGVHNTLVIETFKKICYKI